MSEIMVLQTQSQSIRTVDEFIVFAQLPENAGHNLEFINGKVIEKLGSTTRNAQIPLLLSAVVINHCEARGLTYFISGADGEFCIDDWCFIPDFAFKDQPVSSTFPDRVPPLWAVEIVSPTENPAPKRRKYIESGILLWEVYPEERVIDVYAPGAPLETYEMGSTIDVGVVAGLYVDVSKLFR